MRELQRPDRFEKLTMGWRHYVEGLESELAAARDATAVAHGEAPFEASSAFYVPRWHGVWQDPLPLPKYSDLVMQPQGNPNREVIMREPGRGQGANNGWVEIAVNDGQLVIEPRFPNTMFVKRQGHFES